MMDKQAKRIKHWHRVATAALVVCLLWPVTAFATFAGSNGVIAVGIYSDAQNPPGPQGIYLFDSGAEPRFVAQGFSARFSADGSELSLEKDGDIYLIEPDGSNSRRVTGNCAYTFAGPVWSPDDSRIAYDKYQRPVTSSDRWVEIRDLATGATVSTLGNHPVWAPDSQRIAFSDPGAEIAVLNLDGTSQAITSTSDSEYDYAPDWAPDGSDILFTHMVTTKQSDNTLQYTGALELVDPEGKYVTTLTSPPGGYEDEDASWSPDGTRIVFVRSRQSEPGGRVVVVNRDGSGLAVLTPSSGNYGPQWSPDGTKILFQKYGSSYDGVVETMDSDGSDVDSIGGGSGQNYIADSWQPLNSTAPSPPTDVQTYSGGCSTHYSSTVDLKITRRFVAKGAVTSSSSQCTEFATVAIRRGTRRGWRHVAITSTGDSGSFRVKLPRQPGYYDAVKQFLGFSDGSRQNTFCDRSVSGAVSVP